VKRAHDATLEEREYAFNRVRMNIRSWARIFAARVMDAFVTALECTADAQVSLMLVSDQSARQIRVLCNELAETI
jgi:hypothetical protein